MPGFNPRNLTHRIRLEVETDSEEVAETGFVSGAGEEWARGGDWDVLAENVLRADDSRVRTLGGVAHRALLMSGALRMIDAPIAKGDNDAARAALAVLQMAQAAAPRCPVRAALAARANVGFAWSLRGDRPTDAIPQEDWSAINARLCRVHQILGVFQDDPGALLAEARYRAGVLAKDRHSVLPGLYQAWAEADPEDPTPMAIHGFYLTPRWGGAYSDVELEARRAALRTDERLGFAGYAMVFLPLLEHEPDCLAAMDPLLFVEGVDDWLSACPEPGRINAALRDIAAVCADNTVKRKDRSAESEAQQALAEALPGLISRHLRRVALDAWQGDAHRVREMLARAFAEHMATGGGIDVTEAGLHFAEV